VSVRGVHGGRGRGQPTSTSRGTGTSVIPGTSCRVGSSCSPSSLRVVGMIQLWLG
jgi:hypothetical protein